MTRILIGLAGVFGFTGVGIAALAAHLLGSRLDENGLALIQTADQMQIWHALALLGTAIWASRGGVLARAAGLAFAIGTILFCGSVYAIAFQVANAVAPIGGVILLLGWLLLTASAVRPAATA